MFGVWEEDEIIKRFMFFSFAGEFERRFSLSDLCVEGLCDYAIIKQMVHISYFFKDLFGLLHDLEL